MPASSETTAVLAGLSPVADIDAAHGAYSDGSQPGIPTQSSR
jgi:hypothetical protein